MEGFDELYQEARKICNDSLNELKSRRNTRLKTPEEKRPNGQAARTKEQYYEALPKCDLIPRIFSGSYLAIIKTDKTLEAGIDENLGKVESLLEKMMKTFPNQDGNSQPDYAKRAMAAIKINDGKNLLKMIQHCIKTGDERMLASLPNPIQMQYFSE